MKAELRRPSGSVVARFAAAQCALGLVVPDTVITNATVFNVFTAAFEPDRELWVKEGLVAYTGAARAGASVAWDRGPTQVIDAGGMTVLPGLIDGHTHLPDAVGIEEFVRHVVPTGTTTLVMELMEVAMVGGETALRAFAAGLAVQPVRLFYTVPALAAPVDLGDVQPIPPHTLASFLDDPRCLGVGEVYWGSLLRDDEQGCRLRALAQAALERGKTVEGHGAGASGEKLQAYAALGPSSCHEAIDEAQARERLALGYRLMVREGGVRQELEQLKDVLAAAADPGRSILVTDSVDPGGLLERGYLEVAVRRALCLGLAPELVYRMVTINVAEHFRVDHLVGSLAPGRSADLVLIPSPGDYRPQLVMCRGQVIFRPGEPAAEPVPVSLPTDARRKIRLDLGPLVLPSGGRVRAMELVSRLVTRETLVDAGDVDLLLAVALDRFGSGESFLGLLGGYGLRRGACATSITWDTTDVVAVGRDEESLRTALHRLEELSGGAVFAIGRQVVAELPAPIFSIISPEPLPVVVRRLAEVERALGENGVPWERPLLSLDTLTTAAIPHLRISRRGYVRLRDGAILGLEA